MRAFDLPDQGAQRCKSGRRLHDRLLTSTNCELECSLSVLIKMKESRVAIMRLSPCAPQKSVVYRACRVTAG